MCLFQVMMVLKEEGRYPKKDPSFALMPAPGAILPDSLITVVSPTSLFNAFSALTMTLGLLESCCLLQIT